MRSANIDEKVSEEWLQLGSRMAGLVNLIAERQDLIVSIYPDNRTPSGPGASAWFIPKEASINFDARQLLDEHIHPHSVDLYDPRSQAEHIKLMGAMVHECAHAAHTVLNFPKDSNRNHVDWALLLEESRIEKKALARRPQDRAFLRATIKDVVSGGDLNKLPESQRKRAQAAHSAALILGRVDNGVLYEDEVKGLRSLIVQELGEDTLERMRQVWLRAQDLEDGDLDGLVACGKEYYEILQEKEEEHQDQQGEGQQGGSSGEGNSDGQGSSSDSSGNSGESSSSDGSGGGSEKSKEDAEGKSGQGQGEDGQNQDEADADAFQMPCGSWTWGDMDDERAWGEDSDDENKQGDDDLSKEMSKELDEVAEEARKEIKIAVAPKRRNRDKERAEEAREKANRVRNQTTAEQVFSKAVGQGSGSGWGRVNDTMESPNDSDRRNANQLAKELRRARHRDVHRTTVPSMTPPGRMNINQAAHRDAQRARGEQITATPWKQTRRRQVEAPPFSAAISVDVSGSMDAWQRAVSSFAWAVGKATHNQGGKVGAVAWNDDVRVIAKPGKVSKDVVVAGCSGGSRGLARSLDALDGQMDLAYAEGVRVLVILSDGNIGTAGVQERIDRFRKAGVLVLWVGVPSWAGAYTGWIPNHVDHIILKNPQDFGTQVGRFMADALSKYKNVV